MGNCMAATYNQARQIVALAQMAFNCPAEFMARPIAYGTTPANP